MNIFLSATDRVRIALPDDDDERDLSAKMNQGRKEPCAGRRPERRTTARNFGRGGGNARSWM